MASDLKPDTPIAEALTRLFPSKDVTKWVTQLKEQDIDTVADVRLITDVVWRTLSLSPVLISGLGAIRQGKLLVPAGWDKLCNTRSELMPASPSFVALQAQFRNIRQYHSMIVQQERFYVKQIREFTAEFHKKSQDALVLRSLLTDVDDTTLQSYYHFLDGNTAEEPIVDPKTLGAETETAILQYAQFVQYLRDQPRTMALLGSLGGQLSNRAGVPVVTKRRGVADVVCYGVFGSVYQGLDFRHLVRALGLVLHQELSVHRSRSIGDENKGEKHAKALRFLGETEAPNAPPAALYSQSFAIKMALVVFGRQALELAVPFFAAWIQSVCKLEIELSPDDSKGGMGGKALNPRAESTMSVPTPEQKGAKSAILKKILPTGLPTPGKAEKEKKPGSPAAKKPAAAPHKGTEKPQVALVRLCESFFTVINNCLKTWPTSVMNILGAVVREFLRQWPQIRPAHVVFHVFYSLFLLPVLGVDTPWAPPTLFPVYVTGVQSSNLRVLLKVIETILETAAFQDTGPPPRAIKSFVDMPSSLRTMAKDFITNKIPFAKDHLNAFAALAVEVSNVKLPPVTAKERYVNLALSIEDIVLLRDTIMRHLEEVPPAETSTTLAMLAPSDPWTCSLCGTVESQNVAHCLVCSVPRDSGTLNLPISYAGLRKFTTLPPIGAGIPPKRKILLNLRLKDIYLDWGRVSSDEPDESMMALRFMMPDIPSQIEEVFVGYGDVDGDTEQVYDISRSLAQVFVLEHWDRHDLSAGDMLSLAEGLENCILAEMGAAGVFLHNAGTEAQWRSGGSSVALLENLLAWVLLGSSGKGSESPALQVRNLKITSDFKKVRDLMRDVAFQVPRKLQVLWQPREQRLFGVLDALKAGDSRISREIEFLRGIIFHHSLLSIALETPAPLSLRTQVMLRVPEPVADEDGEPEKETNTFACNSISSLISEYRKYHVVLENHRHVGAQLLRCFQDVFEGRLARKLKPEQVKHASELVEAYISTALFDYLFEEGMNGITGPDHALADKLRMGSWVRPAHLGLSLIPEKHLKRKVEAALNRQGTPKENMETLTKAEIEKERQKEEEMLRVLWGKPCEELCCLENVVTPQRKLLCLTRTVKLIFENLKTLSRGATFDADTCLSALIGVIIHTPPIRLMANLQYIGLFRPQTKMDGEDQYCITQFNLAISFITKADFDARAAGSNSLLQSRRETVTPALERARARGNSRILQSTVAKPPVEQVVIPLPRIWTVFEGLLLERMLSFLDLRALAALVLTSQLGTFTVRPNLMQRGLQRSVSKRENAPDDEAKAFETRGRQAAVTEDPDKKDDDKPKKPGVCCIPAVAKHGYDASGKTNGSYLTFVRGEALTITKMKSDRWWWAVNANDARGWVPSSYIQLLEPIPPPPP